jgi:hypothetical protein
MVEPEIRADVGALLDRLHGLGFRVVASHYDRESFGDWCVDLVGPRALRLCKDRSQFMVGGDRQALEPAGLWWAFDDREEFSRRVLAWAAG